MVKILLYLSLVLNFLLAYFILKPTPNAPVLFPVERVIDGDTFVLAGGRQVRLMSVNAPEIGLCGSVESTAKLTELVSGKSVRLKGEINDHFGRFLALVYVDDVLVNQEMINSGWARFTSTLSLESENLKIAFAKAKTDRLGVFSPLCYQVSNPDQPQCNIKGNVREGKKTYFFPGCGNYSNVALELDQGDQWFCHEADAVSSGFTKSANCHGKQY